MVVCCGRGLVVLLVLLLCLLSPPIHLSSPPLRHSRTPSLLSSSSAESSSSPRGRSSSLSPPLVVVDPSSSLSSSLERSEDSLPSAKAEDGSVEVGTSVPQAGSSASSSSPPSLSVSSSSAGLKSSSASASLSRRLPSSSASSSASSSSSSSPSSKTQSSSTSSSAAPSTTKAQSFSASSSASSTKPQPSSKSSSPSSSSARSQLSSRSSSSSSSKSYKDTQAEKRQGGSGGASVRPLSAQDKRVLKAVEKNLLGALGLTSRPRAGQLVDVPPYMWDLYLAQTATPSPSAAIQSPFLKGYGSAGVAANTVRSFYHSDHHVTEGCDPSTCTRLLFNVSTVPHTETLAAAELRVFIAVQGNHSDLGSSQGQPKVMDGEGQRSRSGKERQQELVIEVYEIMQTGGEEEEKDYITRLLDTRRLVPRQDSSWQSFDIHPAVLKWKRGPAFNRGLEIRLACARPSDAKHVRLRRSAELSEEQWRLERPLLVTYTDDGKGAGPKPAPSRSKRAAHSERKRERRRKSRAGKTSKRNRRNRKKKRKKKKRKRTRKGDKNMCRRHALYVDFQEVGWEDWIVAPDGYNAYFCQGDCNFPLAQHLNSTNHAIVQTLVNSVDPTAVSKACCVPTELSAISMLYLNERGKVQLKNYQDMVVEACGCR